MNKLIEMMLDDDKDGVFAISIVSDPAIKSDFLALSDSKVLLKVEDESKKILTGAILIPNIPILRKDEAGEPYHIFFSKDTVNEISQRYLKNKHQDQVTVEHKADTKDVTLIESWIKTDDNHDKSVALGLDVPVGTWLGTMKVDNDELWDGFIKAGHLKGFSIEARMKAQEVSEINTNLKQEEMEENKFLNHIKSFFSSEESAPVVEATEVEEKVEMVTKDEFVELCTKVDTLTKGLEDALKAITLQNEKVEEPQEEIKVEAEEVKPEVIEEPKEEVEMVAHTDADVESEALQLKSVKFNYKLSTSERIAEALKVN